MWRDSIIKKSILLVFFVQILFILIFILKFNDLPPQLPLFYSLPRGNEQLGNPILLLILPLLALFIEITNIGLSIYTYQTEKILSRILMIMSTFISIILFITFIKIVTII